MNKITISDQDFFYERMFSSTEWGDDEWTVFYKEIKKCTRRKYCFFGPKIEYEKPIILFEVNFDIEDASHTKSELRTVLMRKIEILSRKEEIKRGELI